MEWLPEVGDVLTIAKEIETGLAQRDVGRVPGMNPKLLEMHGRLRPAVQIALKAAPSIDVQLRKLETELCNGIFHSSGAADVGGAIESATSASHHALEIRSRRLGAKGDADKWPLDSVGDLIKAAQFAYERRGLIDRHDYLADVGIEAELLMGRINRLEGVSVLKALAAAESRPFDHEWLLCLVGRQVAKGLSLEVVNGRTPAEMAAAAAEKPEPDFSESATRDGAGWGKLNTNERMEVVVSRNPEGWREWTKERWAKEVNRSKTAVQGAKTWQDLQLAKAGRKEGLKDTTPNANRGRRNYAPGTRPDAFGDD